MLFDIDLTFFFLLITNRIVMEKPKHVEHDAAKHKTKSFLNEITDPLVFIIIGYNDPERNQYNAREKQVANDYLVEPPHHDNAKFVQFHGSLALGDRCNFPERS